MIVEYEGKKYERKGFCNQCGDCCMVGSDVCEFLKFDGKGKAFCSIYDQRVKDKKYEFCILFPTNPGNLIGKPRCSFYFEEIK